MPNPDTALPAQPSRFSTQANRFGLSIVLGVVFVVHLLPRLLLGQDSFVTLFDTLDSDFVYRVLIAKPGRFLDGNAVVSELVGGLPRWTYPSALKIGSILFWALRPFEAYVVLETLVAVAGALGMWVLLRDYLPSAPLNRILIAITFGLLPYYSIYDLSVSGQAGVAWALFNLWCQKRRNLSLLVCAVYPFTSSLQCTGAFVVALAAALISLAAVVERKTLTAPQFWWPTLGVVLIGVGYLISDFPFLHGLLFADFVSQRSAWADTPKEGFSFHPMFELWYAGRPYHAESRHTPIFVAAWLSVIWLSVRREWRAAGRIALLILLATALTLTLNVFKSPLLVPLIAVVPSLVQVTLRFWWSLPTIWFFTLGAIAYYWPRMRLHQFWLGALLVLQFVWVWNNPLSAPSELTKNYQALAQHALGQPSTIFSYRQFVSADAFSRIRQHIGTGNTGRFIALGFHPSVLALNGFDCADGYRDLYSLEYKKRFRRLIAGELSRDPANQSYFDFYGNRVYVFLRGKKRKYYSGDPKHLSGTLNQLSLNYAALNDLGVRWVASTFLLQGRAALPFLRYEGTFADASEGFTIYLYQVQALAKVAPHG